MTTPTTTTPEDQQEPPNGSPAPEQPTGDQQAQEPAKKAEEGNTANAEAARYRTRLRETEAERDTIAGRLTGYQRREAERLAAAKLSKPSDLWLDGRDIGDLLDEDGQVDPAKVETEVAAVLDSRPQLEVARVRPRPDSAQGQVAPATKSGWSDVIGGRKA